MSAVKVTAVEVDRYDGQKIQLPTKMTEAKAIEVLQMVIKENSRVVRTTRKINAFPWDGALALNKAIKEVFGVVITEYVENKEIEVSLGETIRVPWGSFSIPGHEASVECETVREKGKLLFMVSANHYKRDQALIESFFDRVQELAKDSIYQGKAISYKWADGEMFHNGLPEIKFLPISDQKPIFSKSLEKDITATILTPIRMRSVLKSKGMKLKRGALLAGEYGTGKTLCAAYIASEAVKAGWTYIYVPNPDELERVLEFGMAFQPFVVMVEDADRIMGEERTDFVNTILNKLDGIENKKAEMMVILTTNHHEKINAAAKRPGRIDRMIKIHTPDAEAVERLIRFYAGSSLSASENLNGAGMILAGQIPAVIQEAVEMAQLHALNRTNGYTTDINSSDLEDAGENLIAEREAFGPKKSDSIPPMQHVGRGLGEILGAGLGIMANHTNGKSDSLSHDLATAYEERGREGITINGTLNGKDA